MQLPPTKIQSRCSECKQVLEDPDLKFFQGDSNEAVSKTEEVFGISFFSQGGEGVITATVWYSSKQECCFVLCFKVSEHGA